MIHGSIVALITPFRDGKLDEDALRKMVAWHVEQGTDGVVPVGTTGECPTLTPEEHCRVIEITAEIAKGKIELVKTGKVSKDNPYYDEIMTGYITGGAGTESDGVDGYIGTTYDLNEVFNQEDA